MPSALTTNIPLQFRKLGFGSNPASPAPSIVSIGVSAWAARHWYQSLGMSLGMRLPWLYIYVLMCMPSSPPPPPQTPLSPPQSWLVSADH